MVRFTPAVYKFLLEEMCSLDDLRAEDPTLHEYVTTTQSTLSVFVCVVCVVCVCACRSKEKNTDYNVYVLHTHTLI